MYFDDPMGDSPATADGGMVSTPPDDGGDDSESKDKDGESAGEAL